MAGLVRSFLPERTVFCRSFLPERIFLLVRKSAPRRRVAYESTLFGCCNKSQKSSPAGWTYQITSFYFCDSSYTWQYNFRKASAMR